MFAMVKAIECDPLRQVGVGHFQILNLRTRHNDDDHNLRCQEL